MVVGARGPTSIHTMYYNAFGGVVVVIGLYTKKLLDIQIRNKYCCICSNTTSEEPPKHVCFRNWEESSQAMEADCALVAFSRPLLPLYL